MKNYQLESMKLASQVLRTCKARMDLEDSIFEGPKDTSDTFGSLHMALLAVCALGVYALTLLALAGKL